MELSKTSPKRLYPARPKRNSHEKIEILPGRRISKCKGPEVGPCPDGSRNSKKVNVESENLRCCKASQSPLSEGLVWCLVAQEALDPGQLHISSGPGSFYCNGDLFNRICPGTSNQIHIWGRCEWGGVASAYSLPESL